MQSGERTPAIRNSPSDVSGRGTQTGEGRAYYENYWAAGAPPPEEDHLTAERVRRFLRFVNHPLSILDLGCGSGRGTRLLRNSGREVVGLDISYGALRRAKQFDEKGAYVQAACEAPLPFASNTFDAVYSSEVVEHLLDPKAMILECRRVLKSSGVLFLSTPYHGLIKNLVVAAVGFERHFDPTGPHIRFFTPKSLRNLLLNADFRPERITCLGRCWPFWMNMVVYARKA